MGELRSELAENEHRANRPVTGRQTCLMMSLSPRDFSLFFVEPRIIAMSFKARAHS